MHKIVKILILKILNSFQGFISLIRNIKNKKL